MLQNMYKGAQGISCTGVLCYKICRKEHKVYPVRESYVTKYVEGSTRYILLKSYGFDQEVIF